jgi:CheY-like chemotaxis protein
MAERILFVDDEPAVLDGYRRILYPDFEIETANGATAGLDSIQKNGPYAVVVSDMRMPVMNGAEFLRRVRQDTPETVRILLTGYTDLGAAIQAINEGHVFRFLTKPCEPEVLAGAISDGLKQYQLITSERALLEKTLLGSIQVLADVLSAASPEAFGRSMRIAQYVRHITGKFDLPSRWAFEAAGTLSQLGCITLEADLIQKAYAGVKLDVAAQERFDAHPKAAMELLKSIPRLEATSWMIGQQLKRDIPEPEAALSGCTPANLLLGARILKMAIAFKELRLKLGSKSAALTQLRLRQKEFDADLLNTLVDLETGGVSRQLRKVPTSRLAPGMILDQEIRNKNGMLLVTKGQELTSALVMRIDSYFRAGVIEKDVMAFVPLSCEWTPPAARL